MYNFENLPVVLFFEINDNQDLQLLKPDNQPMEDGQLEMLWEDIKQKFKERDDASLANRIFALTKEVDFLQAKYNLIHLCVQQLRFAQNEEVLKIIKNLDYR